MKLLCSLSVFLLLFMVAIEPTAYSQKKKKARENKVEQVNDTVVKSKNKKEKFKSSELKKVTPTSYIIIPKSQKDASEKLRQAKLEMRQKLAKAKEEMRRNVTIVKEKARIEVEKAKLKAKQDVDRVIEQERKRIEKLQQELQQKADKIKIENYKNLKQTINSQSKKPKVHTSNKKIQKKSISGKLNDF